MSRRNPQTLLVILSLVFMISGCYPDRPLVFEGGNERVGRELDSCLTTQPQLVVDKINDRLRSDMDSVSYYQLLVLKAKAMFYLSKQDSVKSLLHEALSFCERHSYEDSWENLFSDANNMMGNYYSRLTLMDSANYFYHRAFTAAQVSQNYRELPNIAINVADSYVRRGRFDLGSLWYWKSLTLDDSLGVPEKQRFPTYLGLAQVHMELRDFAACDSFYAKAGCYFSEMEPNEKHTYLNNRGNSYYFRQDYQTALQYFRCSQAIADAWPHMEYERHLSHINLGEIYLLLNQVDSASYYLENCRDFFKRINNPSALYYIDTQLIELALKQKNLPLAKERIKASLNTAHVEPSMLRIRNRYLQHYFEENGDFKQAYFYQTENRRIDDSIRNERVKMRSSEIALKYQLDNKLMQKEILIRQQENEMLRLNQWLYLMVIGALVLVTLVWVYSLYRSRKEEKKVWNMQASINSLRLDNVRNRISPHFIFNVLTHEMSRLQNENDKKNLTTLVHLLRRQLELADQISITLSDELDFVHSVISLEKQSLGRDFDFVIDVDESIGLDEIRIPAMSIYILVENAIKHSYHTKNGRLKLWIRIVSVDDRIEIKLCDNGGGFKVGGQSEGTGTGFKIITRTIQLYNQYNEQPIYMNIHNVDVGDAETGCEVSYSIPKSYKFIIKS